MWLKYICSLKNMIERFIFIYQNEWPSIFESLGVASGRVN